MEHKQELLHFLKSQRFLVVGTQGEKPWIVNVFYGADDDCRLYFVSGEEENHSKHILQNPEVTFSTVWFNENDHTDRKGVQGIGTCNIADTDADIETGVRLHNEHFPEFKERITHDYIRSDENKSRVWVITPKYIKFWNDGLYGDEEWEEFTF